MLPKMLGHLLLEGVIPAGYRPEGVYTNKNLLSNMVRLAKDDPAVYVKTITDVKKLGDEFATLAGLSIGLDDIAPSYKERNAILDPALARMKKTTNIVERRKILAETQEKFLDHARGHPGTMGIIARSGGRGNTIQLMKSVASPTAASDEKDEIQPWLITKSYSEGLKESEWWCATREARMAAVKGNIEVTEPGDLSKILINNSSHQVITEPNCGTHNGLMFSTDDSAILDRHLARDTAKFSAGTLITPRVQTELKKKVPSIMARSPMTCESHEGLCQTCVGLTSSGKAHRIGDNIGIRASQALGEPLTQLSLNAKHGVRLAGADPLDVGGISGFRAILESPESFKNKATLSPIDGKVTRIEKAPQGGHYVTVEDQKLHVIHGLDVTRKIGDSVFKGQTLSTGVPRPDEVVSLMGLGAGRNYLVKKLDKIYKDSGIDIDRRHLETIAKSTLDYLQIDHVNDHDSAEHGLVRGDVISLNRFSEMMGKNTKEVPLKDAIGNRLGESILYHVVGTRVTAQMAEELEKAGIKHVKIGMGAMTTVPLMAAASRNPLLNPDFFIRLGHRYLKKSLVEGAQEGHHSEIHSLSPVPSFVFSAEFGEGTNGKY